jgi:hypothetical protein
LATNQLPHHTAVFDDLYAAASALIAATLQLTETEG